MPQFAVARAPYAGPPAGALRKAVRLASSKLGPNVAPRGRVTVRANQQQTATASKVPSSSTAAKPAAAPGAPIDATESWIPLSIPTADMKQVKLDVLPEGSGQAIVIVGVPPGSEAEEAGLKRGMKLRAISDPVRYSEMIRVGDSPSIRFVRMALNMRRNKYVELEVQDDGSAALLDDYDEPDTMTLRSFDSMSSLSSESESDEAEADDGARDTLSVKLLATLTVEERSAETIGERLARQYEARQKRGQAKTQVQARIARRKEYLSEVSERNDSQFFGVLFAAFVLPAASILAWAYFSGYLDKLYVNSLTLG